jgi:hypothetical protein
MYLQPDTPGGVRLASAQHPLELASRACVIFACPQLAYLLRGLDQRADFGCRVVRGDVAGLVA